MTDSDILKHLKQIKVLAKSQIQLNLLAIKKDIF